MESKNTLALLAISSPVITGTASAGTLQIGDVQGEELR